MECSAHGHDEQWLDEGGENEEEDVGGKVGIPFDMTRQVFISISFKNF